jgi:hypothetical protein
MKLPRLVVVQSSSESRLVRWMLRLIAVAFVAAIPRLAALLALALHKSSFETNDKKSA